MNGHRPTITSTAIAWKPHAIHLAGQLVHAGLLTDGAWRKAMLDVPRHHFVPSYFHAPDRSTWRHQRCPDLDNAADRAAARDWLAHVYDRVPLIVALSGIDMWGRQHPVAVSPDPGLTMRLLHTLDVRPTDRVLELGTGSGHTTALLAHRVGANQVTSVEIDTELHHLAAHRLAQVDLQPHLVLADSTALDAPLHRTTPYPSAARAGDLPGAASARTDRGGFDRVLVGHTVDHIPAAWLRHTNPGALVLATLVGGLGVGHPVLLHRGPVTSDGDTEPRNGGEGRLTGSFLPWPADDLPARHYHVRLAPSAARPTPRRAESATGSPPSTPPRCTETPRAHCCTNSTYPPAPPLPSAPTPTATPRPTSAPPTAAGPRSTTAPTATAGMTPASPAPPTSSLPYATPATPTTTLGSRTGPSSVSPPPCPTRSSPPGPLCGTATTTPARAGPSSPPRSDSEQRHDPPSPPPRPT